MLLIAVNGVTKMKTKTIRIVIFLGILAGIALAVIYRDVLDFKALQQWVHSAGIAGPILFMLLYIIGTVFFFPGSILTLAGGALFGPLLGSLYSLTAATIGGTISFLMARYLASDWVSRQSGGRLKQIIEGVENEGWRFVAFVRLVPLFPFNLLNYALGLTKIKLGHYVLASFVCMLPGAVAFTYLGYVGSEAVIGDTSLAEIIQIGSIAIALLVVVAYLPRLIARLRQGAMMSVEALKQLLDSGQSLLILDVRTAEEFAGEQGHIENAKNIALQNLGDYLDEISDYREKPIALVCTTDRRSTRAALLLTRQGYADVHVVKGGMTDWNKKHYKVAA